MRVGIENSNKIMKMYVQDNKGYEGKGLECAEISVGDGSGVYII